MSQIQRSHITHMTKSCLTVKQKWHARAMRKNQRKNSNCICRSHVTHVDESCYTHEGVMSHIWRSHVAHLKEPCHSYAGVISHIWRSHVIHMKESCRTYERVMSFIWRKSYRTYEGAMSFIWRSHVMSHTCCRATRHNDLPSYQEWVMSHLRKSHDTGMKESCHTSEKVTSLLGAEIKIKIKERSPIITGMSRVTCMKESWHRYEGVMSHAYKSHVSPWWSDTPEQSPIISPDVHEGTMSNIRVSHVWLLRMYTRVSCKK